MKDMTRKMVAAVMALTLAGAYLPAGDISPGLGGSIITAAAYDNAEFDGTDTLYLANSFTRDDVQRFKSNTKIRKIVCRSGAILPADCGILFEGFKTVVKIDLSQADASRATRMERMFASCDRLESVDFGTSFRSGNVTDMSEMFRGCSWLEELDLSALDTSSVTNMTAMFMDCPVLYALDLSSFSTAQVTNMKFMFCNCTSLEGLDLSSFDTANVQCMESMFEMCRSLKALDLSSFHTDNVDDMTKMFAGCGALKTITIHEFNTTNVFRSSSMFAGCTSLVGGAGTKYNAGLTDVERAFPDYPPYYSGYFTQRGVTFNVNTGVLTLNGDKFTREDVWTYRENDRVKSVTAAPGTVLPEDCNSMFCKPSPADRLWQNLESVDLSNADSSRATRIALMFHGCEKLKTVDISGFDTSNVIEMAYLFEGCKELESVDMSSFTSKKVEYFTAMFSGCEKLTELDLSGFSMESEKDASWMFDGCYSLKTIYASTDWNNIRRAYYMFDGCTSLVGGNGTVYNANYIEGEYARIDSYRQPGYFTLKCCRFDEKTGTLHLLGRVSATEVAKYNGQNSDKNVLHIVADPGALLPETSTGLFAHFNNVRTIDLSNAGAYNVTTAEAMFYNCPLLTSVKLGNFSSRVTNTAHMFAACNKLETVNIEALNTNNVTDMDYMFAGCEKLGSLDLSGFDTSNVTAMNGMFSGCSQLRELDLSGFNTAKVTGMSNMFAACSSLVSLDMTGWNTESLKYADHMFRCCSKLTELDISSFDTSKVSNMSHMFYSCNALKTIYAGSKWSTAGVTQSDTMFDNCNKLTGGSGSTYAYYKKGDKTYARIDGGSSKPGYFTERNIGFRTNSMTLGGSISLNFYVALNGVPDDKLDSCFVEFTVNGKTQKAMFDRSRMNASKTYYGFNCKLNSVSMADKVNAVLTYYTPDGKQHTLRTVSTAEEYLEKFNENDEEKTWNLIKGINDYGYYMQRYLSKYSSSPWTLGTDHLSMKKAYTTHSTYNSRKNTYLSALGGLQKSFGSNGSIEKVNYTLVLDSDTAINFKIKKESGYTGNVTATVDGKAATLKQLSDGRLQVSVTGIPAHRLNEMHTVRVTTSSGTTVYKAGALSYAYECIAGPKNDPEYDAMCALYEYYKAAVEYKNK
ncbi:MAG: BspA family leucine-rich repeat surface protein [Ruminococcus sp.]|nr:BspA family leucine-rich repeat surface protein [Ruminococcus sp.]